METTQVLEAVYPRDAETQRIPLEAKESNARRLNLIEKQAMVVRRLEYQETQVRLGEKPREYFVLRPFNIDLGAEGATRNERGHIGADASKRPIRCR
jgi:hypothetical protein